MTISAFLIAAIFLVSLVLTMVGIGGGVFVVPLLTCILKTSAKIAAVSSTFIVCFSFLSGFLVYTSMETIRPNENRIL